MTEQNAFADLIPRKRRREDEEENSFADLIPAPSTVIPVGATDQLGRTIPEFRNAPPPLFVDQSGLSTALEVGPAMAGGVMGIPGGPIGVAAGGALGSFAGRGLANLSREIERQVTDGRLVESVWEELKSLGRGEDKVIKASANAAMENLQAATTDLGFTSGIAGVGRVANGLTKFGGKILGAQSPEVQQVIRESMDADVGVGAADLGKRFPEGIQRVLGVIPIVGAPGRQQQQKKLIQASRGLSSILDDISPSVDLPALGVRINASARGALNARHAISNAKYARMRATLGAVERTMEASGEGGSAFIPTQGIKQKVASVLGELDQLPREVVKETENVKIDGFTLARESQKQGERIGVPPSDGSFISILQRFMDLPDAISPSQLEALQKNLSKGARLRSGNQMAANEYRIINEINGAAFDALNKIPDEALPPNALEIVKKSIQTAKRSWVNLKSLEETAAAKPLKSHDANFFKAGYEKMGSAEIDELANLYLSKASILRSPQFIDGMEQLIGKKNRKSLARMVIQRAAEAESATAKISLSEGGKIGSGATDIVAFDTQSFSKALGLSDPDAVLGAGALRKNKIALARLLEGTGVSVARLQSFLNTVKRVQEAPGGDPSTFLARRMVLSGSATSLLPGAILAGGGAGAAASAKKGPGLIKIGGALLLTRHISKLITSPEGLKTLRDGLRPNLTRAQSAQLKIRLIRAFPNEEWESFEPGELQRF